MADIFDTFGERYQELLPSIIKDIEKEIAILTRPLEAGKVSDQLKLQYLIENKAELERYIKERYNQAYLSATSGMYTESINNGRLLFDKQGIPFDFRKDQLDYMAQLKQSNTLLYSLKSTEAADQVFNSLLQWAYTGSTGSLQPFTVAIDSLGASKYGQTIINTQIASFNRSVTAVAAENAGIERFRYVGPKPDRPFCEPLIGKVFTREEIDQMDNGQTADVLRTAGGYNCRHQWIPIQENTPRA